jgi:hypothetical protein
LEPRHDHDVPGVERFPDAPGSDVDDLGLPVLGIGDDARLRPRIARRAAPHRVDGDRQGGHRDSLPRREEQIQLAGLRQRSDGLRHGQELVGRVAHRRDHDHDVVAPLAGMDDPPGDGADAVHAAHGGPPVLLHDHRHVRSSQLLRSFERSSRASRAEDGATSPRDGEPGGERRPSEDRAVEHRGSASRRGSRAPTLANR